MPLESRTKVDKISESAKYLSEKSSGRAAVFSARLHSDRRNGLRKTGGAQRPFPYRGVSFPGGLRNTVPSLKAPGTGAMRPYQTIFKPITDAISVTMKNRRANVSGSWKHTIPSTTVPTAPIPVHTG